MSNGKTSTLLLILAIATMGTIIVLQLFGRDDTSNTIALILAFAVSAAGWLINHANIVRTQELVKSNTDRIAEHDVSIDNQNNHNVSEETK